MKKLNESRAMRLAVLSEDCGKAVQTIATTFQHGPDVEIDYNEIEERMGELLASAAQLALTGDISWTNVMKHAERKNGRLKKVC